MSISSSNQEKETVVEKIRNLSSDVVSSFAESNNDQDSALQSWSKTVWAACGV